MAISCAPRGLSSAYRSLRVPLRTRVKVENSGAFTNPARNGDSGGKSGGQKEKLAYTVLAASLAYQYGLGDAGRPRHFRFVVIDEAFGRGSDESARFGLELFAKLQLQLLIATPLQKVHVIEPYVAHVGFVSNRDGSDSMIRNLTIDEYRAEISARGYS